MRVGHKVSTAFSLRYGGYLDSLWKELTTPTSALQPSKQCYVRQVIWTRAGWHTKLFACNWVTADPWIRIAACQNWCPDRSEAGLSLRFHSLFRAGLSDTFRQPLSLTWRVIQSLAPQRSVVLRRREQGEEPVSTDPRPCSPFFSGLLIALVSAVWDTVAGTASSLLADTLANLLLLWF